MYFRYTFIHASGTITSPYLEQDHRCDIYALGIILFEILVGEKAFKGDYKSIFAIKQDIFDCTYTNQLEKRVLESSDLEFRIKTIPNGLQNIVRQCLFPNREHRYKSARALAEALQNWRWSG